MKSKIEKILEREIDKLDAMSLAGPEPLSPNDVRSLDTLIKAYRSFVDPAKSPAAGPAETGPAPSLLSTDELLNAILDEQTEQQS